MNRPLYIASGISVLFTTLAFSHIMFHDTMHMLSHREDHLLFVVLHSVFAAAAAILSLIGAYSLLTSRRRQDSN